MRFKPVGNMGCRLWWGTPGTLTDRNLGVWDGYWLMGVNGPQEGKYDLKFTEWCRNRGHLFVRTVDLFWAFHYHRGGFPMVLRKEPILRRWEEEKKEWREEKDDYWYPDPGRWSQFYEQKRRYFARELARYRRVIRFWHGSGDSVRNAFLRCARFSNRRPESHPDYVVVFRNRSGQVVDSGFVEVKGPRESLRPSQRRFFPELVRRARHRVWLARFNMRETSIKLEQFSGDGQLIPCTTIPGTASR